MAILVPMQAGTSPVTANISIKGIVFWHFLYSADDSELAKSGTSADVNVFELGEPAKLNRDVNSWHIVLMNPTTATVDFETSIEWTQNGLVVATWPEEAPQKGQLNSKENVVFDDSAFLAILAAETAVAVTGKSARSASRKSRRAPKRGGGR